jgi:hypothetical protein
MAALLVWPLLLLLLLLLAQLGLALLLLLPLIQARQWYFSKAMSEMRPSRSSKSSSKPLAPAGLMVRWMQQQHLKALKAQMLQEPAPAVACRKMQRNQAVV